MTGSNINTGAEMREAVFFDGADVRRKLSRFWTLLVLAAVIAASGVIGDSEATVIGAMIVAPLRIPILGSMLAIVLGDRRNLTRSVLMVVGGATATVAVGYLMAMLSFNDSTITDSSQIEIWSQARLIDLVAAMAVGIVGSISLARRDISDTLPGVAIAISLVPPLTVVGLSLRVGLDAQAWGAFLLFATNVSAILGVGVVTMGLYRVQRYGTAARRRARAQGKPVNRVQAYLVIALSIVVIFAILTQRSISVARDTQAVSVVEGVAADWADSNDWELIQVGTDGAGAIIARFEGPQPVPATGDLREQLDDAGVDTDTIRLDFIPKETVTFDDDG